jgi:hypothetical protein
MLVIWKSLNTTVRYEAASRPTPDGRVLQTAVTIERLQSQHKNQVAGLWSPVGTNFVPITVSHS